METFEQILDTIRPEVSFGYITVSIFRSSELGSYQVGYSVTPTGESLIGDKDGDWLKSWLVIGHESLCGDPLFIDTSQENYPVYTAMHGEGPWDPDRIADSLVGLRYALSAVAEVAKGREHPVALEKNPLTQPEKESVLAIIQRHNPSVDLTFWDAFLK